MWISTSPAAFLESAAPSDLSAIFCPETAFLEFGSPSPLSAFFGCCQVDLRNGMVIFMI